MQLILMHATYSPLSRALELATDAAPARYGQPFSIERLGERRNPRAFARGIEMLRLITVQRVIARHAALQSTAAAHHERSEVLAVRPTRRPREQFFAPAPAHLFPIHPDLLF